MEFSTSQTSYFKSSSASGFAVLITYLIFPLLFKDIFANCDHAMKFRPSNLEVVIWRVESSLWIEASLEEDILIWVTGSNIQAWAKKKKKKMDSNDNVK